MSEIEEVEPAKVDEKTDEKAMEAWKELGGYREFLESRMNETETKEVDELDQKTRKLELLQEKIEKVEKSWSRLEEKVKMGWKGIKTEFPKEKLEMFEKSWSRLEEKVKTAWKEMKAEFPEEKTLEGLKEKFGLGENPMLEKIHHFFVAFVTSHFLIRAGTNPLWFFVLSFFSTEASYTVGACILAHHAFFLYLN